MNFYLDPVAFEISGFAVRWYGLCFSAGLIVGFFLMEWFFRRDSKEEQFECFLPFGLIGAIFGARLGHFLFYFPKMLIEDPLIWLKIWQAEGMSSHGAMFGLLFAFYLCSRKCKTVPFIWLCERGALTLLLIGFFIRIGNFLNGEILGQATTLPWGIIFLQFDNIPRHPVQLYESLAYLFIFFIFFRIYLKNTLQPGELLWRIILAVSLFRFLVEIVKEPQADKLFVPGLTNGQLFTIPLFIAAIMIYRHLRRHV